MKKKKSFFPLLLSIILTINSTGCSLANNPNLVDVKESSYYFEGDDTSLESINETCENDTSQTIEDDEIIESSLISVDKNEIVNEYLDYFQNITYNYNGEEYYLSREEMDELIRKSNTIKSCTNEKNIMDIDQLIEIIRSNSQEYTNSQEYVYSSFKSSYVNDDQWFPQYIFESALRDIIESILESSSNDVKEDFCKMQTLSICYGDLKKISNNEECTFTAYYDNENNAIILDYDEIVKGYIDNLDYSDNNVIMYTKFLLIYNLAHEIVHVRQDACDCRLNSGQEYTCIGYSEYVSTLIESSAESYLYNYGNGIVDWDKTYLFYDKERRLEALLFLMGLMNNSGEEYYNAILDSNINALFEFYGAQTDEEKYELYRIIYAIDGVNFRNDLALKFNEDDYKGYHNRADVIGREYCYEIMNKFTIDLIEYINSHDDFTLLDAMCLFNVAQSVCLEDVKYLIRQDENSDYHSVYDVGVVNKINDTRIKFYEFLKQFYEVDNEELLDIVSEANYAMFTAEQSIDYPDHEILNMKDYKYYLELVEKFPLLKSIMFATDASYFNYEHVYDSNGISLVLE